MEQRNYITNPAMLESIKCSPEERETIFNIFKGDKVVKIFCSDDQYLTKLKKNLKEGSDAWKCWEGTRDSEGNITGYFFETDVSNICLRAGNRKKKILTEEQKEAARQRFAKARAERKVKA